MHKSVKIVFWPAAIAAVLLLLAGEAMENMVYYSLGMGLFGVLFLLGLWQEHRRRAENNRRPINSVEATVVSHYTRRERVGHTTVTRWYITFGPADGSPTLTFEVSQLDYEDFDLGEIGPLRYRGWEFLSFGVKDKSDFKPMAPLPEEYEYRPGEPKSICQRIGEKLKAMKPARTASAKHTEVQNNSILTHELDE